VPTSTQKYYNRYLGDGNDKKKDFEILKMHYESDEPLLKNALFIGETGTGKSLCVQNFCYKNKIPYYRVVVNGGTTVEDLIGQMVIDEDGKWKFVYQILIKFMTHGGIVVFDEINAGQKEIMHVLNSITDWERIAVVTQHKGEVIKASKKFMVVATMNPPDEYGLQEMSKSLKSRFCPHYFNYDARIDRLVLGNDKKLLEFARKVREARDNGLIETPLSTRDLKMYQMMGTFSQSVAKESLLTKFQNSERKEIETHFDVCIGKSTILNQGGNNAKP
jgi:transcriptional regulator with PAS, ATPase and Fis domain